MGQAEIEQLEHEKVAVVNAYHEREMDNLKQIERLEGALRWISNNRMHPRCPTCVAMGHTAKAALDSEEY